MAIVISLMSIVTLSGCRLQMLPVCRPGMDEVDRCLIQAPSHATQVAVSRSLL